MAYYLVQAKPIESKLDELKSRLNSKEITKMRPFGNTLHNSLENARVQGDGYAIWEELDYCNPPLAMERAAIIDDYFTELSVEVVESGKGWDQIEDLPSLWGN